MTNLTNSTNSKGGYQNLIAYQLSVVIFDLTNMTYSQKSYAHLSNWTNTPERFSNLLITLISLDCYLLDQMTRSLEQKFITEGGYSENLFKKRLEARK